MPIGVNGCHRTDDITEIAKGLSREEFDNLLNLGEGNASPQLAPSDTEKYTFKLFEAPGFHGTENLQQKITAIQSSIVESQMDIHHVIVTLAPDSISSTTRTVISIFNKLFPDICSHISFVHTKIDLRLLHFSNQPFHESVKDQNEQLRRLTGKIPSIFIIDSSQHNDRAIQRAISQTEAHPILQTAVKDRSHRSVLALVKPKYSMLVLGQTQSGKSTLLENMWQYANPDYKIGRSLLGNGIFSMTLHTIEFTIDPRLPLYEVFDKTAGTVLDMRALDARCEDADDFFDLLQYRKGDYIMRVATQGFPSTPSALVKVKFLDTPGLNDTDHKDVILATNIIKEVVSAQSFNLILFTVSTKVTLSPEYGFALGYYANVLEGLHSRIAFLYTHVDFRSWSRFNPGLKEELDKRHQACSKIFRNREHVLGEKFDAAGDIAMVDTNDYMKFVIDMHQEKRPILQCLLQNRIRDILKSTVGNSPAVLDTSKSNISQI